MRISSVLDSDKITSFPQLRPLNIKRDLLDVAHLVELCFSDTLDQDGRHYIMQLRNAAKNPNSIGFPGYIGQSIAGYVWEEQGVVVGNISMIPVFALNKQAFLIANVAVHPNYRRQGIAKALTVVALKYLKKRKIQSVWLQVNAENPAAYNLYNSLGFLERARRTTWHGKPNQAFIVNNKETTISSPRRKDWLHQKKWLQLNYPKLVSWHLAINISRLRPGIFGSLNRFFEETKINQWASHHQGELIGTLSWQHSNGMADWLWLACNPENDDLAFKALLSRAFHTLKKDRLLTINYQAGRANQVFTDMGFKSHRTLVWMHRSI